MNKKKILSGIIGVSLFLQPIMGLTAHADIEVNPVQILKMGMREESVVNIQQRLKALGYFNDETTGYFGKITEEAVKKFQRDNQIDSDGVVGKDTFNRLYGGKDGSITVSRGMNNGEISEWSWFGKIKNIVSIGTVFKITDVETGKEFYGKRTYGVNHADAETLTKEDTEVMKTLYDNKWSWDRRAITVEVAGYKLPASMAGMPHGLDSINNNGIDGHFDVHFLNSKTHGTNRVDPNHQKEVQIATKFINNND